MTYMETDKKQDAQKTIVAFVAGLLIGGLLVWVFSATDAPDASTDTTTDESAWSDSYESEDDAEDASDEANDTQTNNTDTTTDTSGTTVSDGGALTVENQDAGVSVELANVVYPAQEGWIVVHEVVDGVRGNALGAARFDTAVGLTPESVRLLRATEVGSEYHVLFYTEDGNKAFNLDGDTPIDGSAVVFTAQ